MKRVVGTIACIAAVAAAGWWFYQSNSEDAEVTGAPARARVSAAPVVGVTPVGLLTFVQSVEGLGTARANESVTITAKLTDTVRRINFEDGQLVEEGAVLVELTNREQEALLAEARAALGDAEAQLKRINDLGARGLAAQSEVDQAVAAADGAQARLNTVLARLQDRLIRAPFPGLLGFRQVSPGSLVTPTTPITTLDDVSVIKLDFTLPETQLSFLEEGLSITARSAAWGDRTFSGEISSIGSRIDPVTRAIEVRAVLDNSDGLIRPGMLMSVAVASDEHQALAVNQGALVSIGNVTYVYVVDDADTVQRREVQLGLRTFDEAEVLKGLRPGERVVTEGVGNVRDGVKVTVKAQPSARLPAVGAAGGTASSL
ncbi:MAG: efflux RND transporter periplasmic adaptor subunit [Pseudomonadota bacterium]